MFLLIFTSSFSSAVEQYIMILTREPEVAIHFKIHSNTDRSPPSLVLWDSFLEETSFFILQFLHIWILLPPATTTTKKNGYHGNRGVSNLETLKEAFSCCGQSQDNKHAFTGGNTELSVIKLATFSARCSITLLQVYSQYRNNIFCITDVGKCLFFWHSSMVVSEKN